MAAIEVKASLCIRRAIVLAGVGLAGMLVLVVTQMLGLLVALVSAIHRHGRPAGLKRQQGEHKDNKPTTHEEESSS